MTKKQKGFSFVEANVAIVIFLLGILCILALLSNLMVAAKRVDEIMYCTNLAQWKLAEVMYLPADRIGNARGNFPPPFDKYKYFIEKLSPADSKLNEFVIIKITTKGSCGGKTSLVILKKETLQMARGIMAFIRNESDGNSSIYLLNLGEKHPTATKIFTNDKGRIFQLGFDYKKRYIYYLDGTGIYRIKPDGTEKVLFAKNLYNPPANFVRLTRFSLYSSNGWIAWSFFETYHAALSAPKWTDAFSYETGQLINPMGKNNTGDPVFAPNGYLGSTGWAYRPGSANDESIFSMINSKGNGNTWNFKNTDFTHIFDTDYGNSFWAFENIAWSPNSRYVAIASLATHYGEKLMDGKCFILDTSIPPASTPQENSRINRVDIASFSNQPYTSQDGVYSPEGLTITYRPIWISDNEIALVDIVDPNKKTREELQGKLVIKDRENPANEIVLATGLSKELLLNNNIWTSKSPAQDDYKYQLQQFKNESGTVNKLIFSNGSDEIVSIDITKSNGVYKQNQKPIKITNGFSPVIYNEQ